MEWKVIKLGELCRIELGKTPSRSNEFYWDKNKSGNNVWLSIADLPLSNGSIIYDSKEYISNAGKQICKVVPKGTLIVSFKLSIGRLAITGRDLYTNEAIASLYINEEKGVNQDYLCWYLTFFDWDLAAGNEVKLKGKTLNKAKLKEIEILAPSIPEQKRIVDQAFADLEQVRAKTEQNLKNARELFASYLNEVFKNNALGTEHDALNDICELIVDCEHKTAPKQETGYPSIRTPNIGKGVLILEGVNRVSEETYIAWTRRAIPKEGDLILAREAPAGNIAVIPKDVKVCLGQRTVLIRPKKDKLLSKYLAFLILSPKVQKQLLSHSTGATVQHINMKDIRAFKIYNRPSLLEQEKIVSGIDKILNKTKKTETIYSQKIDNLDELKKSILQKAFSGELTAKAE